VYTTTVGTAPQRDFVIEWRASRPGGFTTTFPPRPVRIRRNFEVIFHENSPVLTMAYGTPGGAEAVIGLEEPGGSFTQYSCKTASVAAGTRLDFIPDPTVTDAPVLSGNAQVDATLTTSTGTWTGTAPLAYAYQWKRCPADGSPCADISGTTGASYTATAGDLGMRLLAVDTATSAKGSDAAASAESDLVQPAAPDPVKASEPSIAGRARLASTLVASPGTWTGTGPISFAYEWLRCDELGTACLAIDGATSEQYVAVLADVGRQLRVRVTATSAKGSADADSEATVAVANPLDCTVAGRSGADTLVGTRGPGFGGDDVLRGRGGADVLVAGDGSDLLVGGRGPDRLVGGAGNDELLAAGDGASDRLLGGPGRDGGRWDRRDRATGVERRG